MNYTIPKSRQQAIEIFDEIIERENSNWLVDNVPTKYHMFIGALTECSDIEFKNNTRYNKQNIINCQICEQDSRNMYCDGDCNGFCGKETKKLFRKRWNE